MAIDVRPEIVIRRPRAEVAAYMFDPRFEREWTKNVQESRPTFEGRMRAGGEVERTVRFLGRTFPYRYRVVAAEGDALVELQVEQPFPMTVRYELSDTDGGTRACIRASGEPGGFFGLASPLLAIFTRRAIAKDLAELRRRIEALPAP